MPQNNGRIGKLKDDLARAKEKAAEWQAKARDIERQIIEQENLEILRTVRSIVASPEELPELLERIRAAGLLDPPAAPKEDPPDGGGEEGQQWRESM